MNFKKNMSLILSSALVFTTLASCGSSASSGYTLHDEMYYKHDNDDGIYEIAVVTKSSKSEYWNTVVQAMMDRADEFESVQVIEYSAENERDVNGNVLGIEKAIAWESDAIVVAPTSIDSAAGMVDHAKNSRIPVVMMDGVTSSKSHDAVVAPDYKEMGAKAAEMMADGIPDGGRIIIIGNLEQSPSEKIQIESFMYEIEKNYPNIEVLATEYCEGVKGTAADKAKTYFTTYTDVQGVFATSSEATIGVAETVELLERQHKTYIVGFGENEKIEAGIETDLIGASFAIDPYQMGIDSFNTALAIIQGNELSNSNITSKYSVIK